MSEVVQIFLEALSTVRVAPTSRQGLVLLTGGHWFLCTLPFFLLSVVVSSSDFSSASLRFPKPPIFRVRGQIQVLRAPEVAGLKFRSAFISFLPSFKPYRSGTLLLKLASLGSLWL